MTRVSSWRAGEHSYMVNDRLKQAIGGVRLSVSGYMHMINQQEHFTPTYVAFVYLPATKAVLVMPL